jgi:hypothetical protein
MVLDYIDFKIIPEVAERSRSNLFSFNPIFYFLEVVNKTLGMSVAELGEVCILVRIIKTSISQLLKIN